MEYPSWWKGTRYDAELADVRLRMAELDERLARLEDRYDQIEAVLDNCDRWCEELERRIALLEALPSNQGVLLCFDLRNFELILSLKTPQLSVGLEVC